ncbi:MAG: discoidin domain-containing protein [Sedimentisphaerales bacterium]|nr:discoidin domain-containing protein [Sedimentisphaerales bacterium]
MSRRSLHLVVCLLVSGLTAGLLQAQSVKINFQTSGSPVPAGYLPDYGLVFADRGNGWSYGWTRDVSADARQRNSANAPDSRWDTLVHLQKGGNIAIWEIALVDGLYDVYIVSGDPSYTDHTNVFDVEGVIVQDLDTPSDNYDEFIVRVWVRDGRLSIAPAQGAFNSRICFVDITLVRYLSLAWNPSPADMAADIPYDVVLRWNPGDYAATHDVYLGRDPEAVANATRSNPMGVLVSQDQSGTSFDPRGLLEFGQRYYWRVDEVNPAPDRTIYKGHVWSFAVEPYSYPIRPVAASASSSAGPDYGPEKTIDGSGLSEWRHGTLITTMWLAGATPAWVAYDLGAVYKLDQMWVWNSNSEMESFIGLGAREVTIEASIDGYDWTSVGDKYEFAQAPGKPDCLHTTEVDLAGVVARYVRLNIHSNWAGSGGGCGLAEVVFFYVPVAAFGPQPADGATGVCPASELYWRSGRLASEHRVYLGTDPDAVKAGTVVPITTKDHSLAMSDLRLDYSTTYYWRVDEVNGTTVWPGELWSFGTCDYAVVDDFESYDDNCRRIFFTWLDGAGHNGAPSCGIPGAAGNGTGSTVGNVAAPFAEMTLVHSGSQSMPLGYNGLSETTCRFDPAQDWTAGGLRYLVLYFMGEATNAPGQLYLKVNGQQVNYPGKPEDITLKRWRQWVVDLSGLSGLRSVSTLTIGLNSSGSGKIYLDDIRLYRYSPSIGVPTDPGTVGLAAAYSFEGNCQDISGNGLHGTAMNGPTYLTGRSGKCISFDGTNDYVELPIGNLIASSSSITISVWVNWSGEVGNWQRIFDLGTGTTDYMSLVPSAAGGVKGVLRFAIAKAGLGEFRLDGQRTLPKDWHHVAVVIDGSTKLMHLYLDDEAIATGVTGILPKDLGPTNQNWLARSRIVSNAYYKGKIDELMIYNRALSPSEVAYLAGDRP